MKNLKNKTSKANALTVCLLTALAVSALAFQATFTGCENRFPSEFVPELPETPDAWVAILGEPHWQIEWIDPDGQKQTAVYPPSKLKNAEIRLPLTWASPVTAYPYWPSKNLPAKLFKPCGAIFPFDVIGNQLRLSREAGADSIFYFELALAYKKASGSSVEKTPNNFDWVRFRELFKSGSLNEAVCKDPWVVDWRAVAEKTAASNFDKRRIVPQAAVQKTIPVPAGTWYGTSPFAEPLHFEEGEPPVFPVRSGINIWISSEGVLKVNGDTWIFTKNEE